MSYIDAIHDRNQDRIYVVERDTRGNRVYQDFPANYTFYYPDPKGKFRTIYGDPVAKFKTNRRKEFDKEKRLKSKQKLFESDFNPVFRCLADNYLDQEAPELHTCFFDLEVAFDVKRGYAPTHDPFNPVTAIGVYLDWLDQLITLVIKPPTMDDDTANDIVSKYENVVLCKDEVEMFEMFFDLIEDADILTGWNSEGYDIPYSVNRVQRILSKEHTKRFCLWGQLPRERTYERFGKEESTYDLVGRVHMDYLQLYKKYNFETRQSYKLDSIGELEVGENKTSYEGTLHQLYHNDFKLFIDYNQQDVMLLVKIHRKRKFLDLANAIAHDNAVPLATVMGSVGLIEQAIAIETHTRGFVVQDKPGNVDPNAQTAAGAYVATPKRGLHRDIGIIDLNSLYPSLIRALNMSPETLVGQVRHTLTDPFIKQRCIEFAPKKKRKQIVNFDTQDDDFGDVEYDEDGNVIDPQVKIIAKAWEGVFACLEYTAIMNRESTMLHVDFEDGKSYEMSAADIYSLIFETDSGWILSANGTIFTVEKAGVIPGLLTGWYVGRQDMQHKKSVLDVLKKGIPCDFANLLHSSVTEPVRLSIDAELLQNLVVNNDTQAVQRFIVDFGLIVENGKILAQPKWLEEFTQYWDKRQHVRKILLNSLYGAYLNKHFRYYDVRVGQSVTLSGRTTVKHQCACINELITGIYQHDGEAIIYGDTDSAMFSAYSTLKTRIDSGELKWGKDDIIAFYDRIGEEVNASFPAHMKKRFNCPEEFGRIIAAGREIVADTGLFIKKKRYAMNCIDKDGKRLDVDGKSGKLKAMGLELKRSDTPKSVQVFLESTLKLVLKSPDKSNVVSHIKDFKYSFTDKPPQEKGSPRAVNKLTMYGNMQKHSVSKVNMPGHVRASLNWNYLRTHNGDNVSMEIIDGARIVVCKLRPNHYGFTSVAYPTDEPHLPQWFLELPFDEELMEKTLIDDKIENMLGVLGWDLSASTDITTSFNDIFSYD